MLTQVSSLATTVIAERVLVEDADLANLGALPTFTRFIGDLYLHLPSGAAPSTAFMAILWRRQLEAAAPVFDPTSQQDIRMRGVIWTRRILLEANSTTNYAASFYREQLDIRAQRKIEPHSEMVFVIESNGATIEFLINGRSLMRAA